MKIVELTENYIDFLSKILGERWELDDVATNPKNVHFYINRWLKKIDGSICFILISDETPVGYAVFDVYNELEETLYPWCLSLWIHQEYRGKNFGAKLTQKRFEHARNLGYKEIFLDTVHAKSYHEKFGWSFVKEITYYGETITIMKHNL